MPKPIRTTNIEVQIIGVTEKALRIDTGSGRYWVPKSLIINIDEIPESVGAHTEAHIETWFVEKEEIH